MTHIIDTADWRLTVPLKPGLALAGSRLRATITPIHGGAPVAQLDSIDGSIAWVASSDGLTREITVLVTRAMRGAWLAEAPTTLAFDVHRTVPGSDLDEGLGRCAFLALPASDSALVTAHVRVRPVLITPSVATLPALQVGPQGSRGEPGAASDLPDLQDLATLFVNGLI